MIKLPIPSMNGYLTERLQFRTISLEDHQWWMEYINDAQAIYFMPFTVGSMDDCTRFIQRSLDRLEEDGSGLNAVIEQDSDRPIGMIGLLTQVVDDVPELEIGYHLIPSAWGKGYATEAAIACREFTRDHYLAPSVISLIDHNNIASQRVAQRNEMIHDKDTVHRGTPAMVFRHRFRSDH